MQINYKRLGDYIREVDVRNEDDNINTLLGINIDKFFMPSVANVVGTDLSRYKIVSKEQFACNRMHVGRDKRLPIALSTNDESFIVSPAYDVFEIIDTQVLLPEYLMMWFSRSEFDRNTWFYTDADVRGGLSWNTFLEMQLPIPTIEKQREIVAEYQTIQNRINLNNQLIQKLEETAQAVYKHWFVNFEFPDENGKPYKSFGGKMEKSELGEIPKGWRVGRLNEIAEIIMGQSPDGESYNTEGDGMIFYQGRTDFGYRYPDITTYTTQPIREAKEGDVLMSVRAPVGDLNIAVGDCCIGRGLASLRSLIGCNSFLFYLMQSVRKEFDISNDEGTIFGSITKDGLNETQIIISSDNEIRSFEEKISVIDENIRQYTKQEGKLRELKFFFLSKLVTI